MSARLGVRVTSGVESWFRLGVPTISGVNFGATPGVWFSLGVPAISWLSLGVPAISWFSLGVSAISWFSLGVPTVFAASSAGLGKRGTVAFSGVGVLGMVRERRAGCFSAGVATGTGDG